MIDGNNVNNGIMCLTFDDRNFNGWINAIPIFEKYDAHASFFVSGEIDDEAISTMKVLSDKGHTVGLHSLGHVDAPEFFDKYSGEKYYEEQIKEQIEKCLSKGIIVKSFGYPNNRRTQYTDEILGQYFDRFRAGIRDADESEIFVPISMLSKCRVMRGMGIGEYYNTKTEELLDIIKRVSNDNTCVTFFSHNIEKGATHIHMPTELLELVLSEASDKGVKMLGLDELPMGDIAQS